MFFVAERQTRPLSPVATEPGARRGAHAPGAEHVFRPVARGGPFPGEAPCALRASSVPLTQPRGPNATETEIESGNGTQRRGISLRLCDLGARNAVTAAPTAPSHLSRLRTSRSATACHAGPPVVPAGRVRIARAGPVRGSRRVHACARTCVSRLTRPGLPVGLQSGGLCIAGVMPDRATRRSPEGRGREVPPAAPGDSFRIQCFSQVLRGRGQEGSRGFLTRGSEP